MTLRERRRTETKTEILDAAWALCRDVGLAGLSLRELAEQVGMRAPSLYSYFESKNAIYDAMFRQGYEQFGEDMTAVVAAGAADRDGLEQGARAFFGFCTADPQRYQLLFQRTIPGFEPSPESWATAVEQFEVMRRTFAESGLGGDEAVDLWTALLTGLTDQQISNDPGGDRWERLIGQAVDMFMDHVGAPPRTTRREQ
ncbi:MAG: TetR/AcrR family transcriptional regulator [Actinomycetota bacterium]|nr:TetR/AcrR family transcriptional regulator [Actinomycetota bacterium]